MVHIYKRRAHDTLLLCEMNSLSFLIHWLTSLKLVKRYDQATNQVDIGIVLKDTVHFLNRYYFNRP